MTEFRVSERRDASSGQPDLPEPIGQRGVEARESVYTDDFGMFTYSDIPRPLAEGVRSLVNRYELRTGTKLPKTVAVTSALSGEGVTTVSQALATVLAQETGAFVCWVDFSWLKNDGSGRADRADRFSLLESLSDWSSLKSAVHPSPELPNLLRFVAGAVPDTKRNAILKSAEFDELMDVLSEEFDHLIFDVPAVIDTSTSLVVMRRADASLLVVRHRSTTVNQVERALELLNPTPSVGVLLNQYRPRVPSMLRRQFGG